MNASSNPSVAKVGEAVPAFTRMAVRAGDQSDFPIQLRGSEGRWLVLIFYPRDFSFVCPTELTAFSARLEDFQCRGCQLLGISVDTIELHREWLTTAAAQGGLGPLRFPLASDPDGAAARAFGVWVEEKGVSLRGLFLIDPEGILQYSVIHNLSVGRSPDEVLRVIDALQTGGLCPANWTAADGTIDAERALQPGRILGNYRIRRKLGGGTFGTVFAAWDMRLERTVALKILKRTLVDSREAALAEARVAARLNHPHVCAIYSVEEIDGLSVIVMEYLDGSLLTHALEDLSRDRVPRLAAQIAAGLAAAHARDIVHGDLKPANVMITKEGTAKILDFGLSASQRLPVSDAPDDAPPETAAPDRRWAAADVDATIDHHDSATGKPAGIRGTLAYMAPEQAAGLPATAASDVFSLGLMLVEMLTGRRALVETRPIDLLLRLESDNLASEIAAGVDDAYRELLTAMLSREATRRPPVEEVARTLAAMAATDAPKVGPSGV